MGAEDGHRPVGFLDTGGGGTVRLAVKDDFDVRSVVAEAGRDNSQRTGSNGRPPTQPW
jgi:hypothetical protein